MSNTFPNSVPPSVPPTGASVEQRAIFAKIAWRVMPVLFLVFVLAYMDRVNIGFAKLQFSRELRLTDTMYGQAAGIFFFGYMLSGIPSNLLLAKVGARATICGIMVTWGSVSSMMMLVSTPAQLYLLRFLLGLAEGGLAPGVYLYLTYWFPATMRARMLAVFLAAVPVAGIVCAPLSGYVLATMHDMYGLRGWQWMFLLEGVPSIVAGIAVYFVLQDSPQTANWLTAKEKQWIGSMLASDMRASSLSQYRSNVSEALTSRTFLTLAIVETIGGAAVSGFAYWLPQIVHDLGVRSLSHNGLITAIPSVCAGIGMVIWSYSSDRFRERKWHYASAAAASAIALLVAGRSGGDFYVAIAALSLAYTGILSCVSVFWAYATTYLRSDAAVVGIGVLNSVAASAGYLTQYGLGALSMATHNSLSGLYFIAIAMLAGGSLMLILPGNGGPLQTSTTVRSALLRRPFRRSSDGD